jgi:hypothetical protein
MMVVQLIPCSVIQLAFTWNGKAALMGGFFTFKESG